MELSQLITFKQVVEHRSFTRAAVDLYITQPAVSHQIRTLEEELKLVEQYIASSPNARILPGWYRVEERVKNLEARIAAAKTKQ